MKPEPRIAKALAKLEGMPTNDPRIRDKTIQEIAVLALERLDSLAPPSQGKVSETKRILDDLSSTLESYIVEHHGPSLDQPSVKRRYDRDMAIVHEARELSQALTESFGKGTDDRAPEGHGAACYYCGEPCNSFAGNPALWPIPLCHRDDPGITKWHHTGCVTSRLVENQPPSQGTDGACCEAMREAILSIIPGGDICDPQQIADAIRALPLPVSADGSAQDRREKALTIVTILANTPVEGWLSRKDIHAALAEFNPKQPDTGAGK